MFQGYVIVEILTKVNYDTIVLLLPVLTGPFLDIIVSIATLAPSINSFFSLTF